MQTPGHGNLSYPQKATLSSVGFLELTGQRQIVACRAVQTDWQERGSKKAAASNTVDLPASKLKNLHHFVRGTWQHGYAQAWTKVRKVYFPYNLKGSHWVAIELDFVRHTATVYDSYIDYTKRSKLVTLLHPISDTLARVLFDMHFMMSLRLKR
ncbi:DNA glycosylase superfamily protein [Prunus dulcis]|uniref:DNA glycosylase superfamily protein n=1 Tax=Prunus dulcis TaxID=3755 RepID=A0A4Y1RGM3_PRUDU|nr:DNA glycosylase superfamily protein [Prunus dulcis]